ncbi:MAG: hypothetical protein ABIK15_18955 [Pseudomonadota bacterium]
MDSHAEISKPAAGRMKILIVDGDVKLCRLVADIPGIIHQFIVISDFF